MPALGEEFRSAREARGLTLSDVAEQIHIRSVYLNAIENEDWTQIGAPVYVRGFIRTYARFLGLDAEAAVQRFNETAPAERSAVAASPAPQPISVRRSAQPSFGAVLGVLVALVLVAFVGYEWYQFSQTPRAARAPHRTAAAPSTAPSAAPARTLAPRPAVQHQLALRLTQDSWLRATVDGHTVMEGTYPRGTSKTFSAKLVELRVGNAGGVTVSVNGAPPATLGKDGDVVERRYTP